MNDLFSYRNQSIPSTRREPTFSSLMSLNIKNKSSNRKNSPTKKNLNHSILEDNNNKILFENKINKTKMNLLFSRKNNEENTIIQNNEIYKIFNNSKLPDNLRNKFTEIYQVAVMDTIKFDKHLSPNKYSSLNSVKNNQEKKEEIFRLLGSESKSNKIHNLIKKSSNGFDFETKNLTSSEKISKFKTKLEKLIDGEKTYFNNDNNGKNLKNDKFSKIKLESNGLIFNSNNLRADTKDSTGENNRAVDYDVFSYFSEEKSDTKRVERINFLDFDNMESTKSRHNNKGLKKNNSFIISPKIATPVGNQRYQRTKSVIPLKNDLNFDLFD